MNIKYVVGDATEPFGSDPRIIAHVVNNKGVWGAGFVMALSAKSPEPEIVYREWAAGQLDPSNPLELGNIIIAPFNGLFVANMCAQSGFGAIGSPPIRYTALATCLLKLRGIAMGCVASVHMPRIGCGLAGGDWSRVGPLVQYFLCDRGVPVTVYDLSNS